MHLLLISLFKDKNILMIHAKQFLLMVKVFVSAEMLAFFILIVIERPSPSMLFCFVALTK